MHRSRGQARCNTVVTRSRRPLQRVRLRGTRMPTAKQAALKKVARLMRDLDFCMFTTHTSRGQLRARPMSNNREVEFDGDVWFFSAADSQKIRDIEANPVVHLSYV